MPEVAEPAGVAVPRGLGFVAWRGRILLLWRRIFLRDKAGLATAVVSRTPVRSVWRATAVGQTCAMAWRRTAAVLMCAMARRWTAELRQRIVLGLILLR
ncbi:hypothetical protein [Amycolatopsis echigonensis]|uniref:Uncharacterized protein n=1 Tax=Amycolatopsis echigonensis TaxID=2576905 RepID=A0A8E2B6R5_9PSEU|nr:hypothetical protein [Amycolatopsis echigonensis]MBB2503939.1 hypothetical protein [Amycolatopsis echigonensis]